MQQREDEKKTHYLRYFFGVEGGTLVPPQVHIVFMLKTKPCRIVVNGKSFILRFGFVNTFAYLLIFDPFERHHPINFDLFELLAIIRLNICQD